MKKSDRVLLTLLVLVSGFGLFVSQAGALTNCTYTVSCVYDPNGDHGNGAYDCTVTNVHCARFNDPDCDLACDAEAEECQLACQSEGGNVSQCLTACIKVNVKCISACIPSV